MKRLWIALVPLMTAVPLGAQQHQHPQGPLPDSAMHMCMMMGMHGEAGMILRAKETLGLSPTQVSRLQELQRQTATAMQEHMRQAHAAMQRTSTDARNVLTPEQRQKLETGMAMMREMMHPPGTPGQPGMAMPQMQNMPMMQMMMHCMSMPGMMRPGGMMRDDNKP